MRVKVRESIKDAITYEIIISKAVNLHRNQAAAWY